MANRSKTVEVTFLVDDREANKKLGNIEKSVGKTAKGFGSAATVIKTGFAAVAGSAILDVVGKMDALNIKAEATERRFNTVFGELTAEARAWAEEQKAAFGLSQTGMEGLMAAAQDLLVPLGFTREAAFDMSKEILLTANALSEWTGGTRTAAEAQEIATKAILGERDGLVELGVKISDADVKAELLRKGQDKLTGAALAQATAQATLTLITAKSTDALSAYEDRTGTALAEQKEMESSLAESAQTWAEILKPAIEGAKETMSDTAVVAGFLSEKISGLIPASEGASSKIVALFGPLGVYRALMGEAAEMAVAYDEAQGGATDALIDGTTAMAHAGHPARRLTGEIEDVAETTEDATTALEDFEAEVRSQTDPIYALSEAVSAVASAEQAVIDAQEEFGTKSPEYQETLLALAQKNEDLTAAQLKVAEQSGFTKEEFATHLRSMGNLTQEQIDIIIAEFERVNAFKLTDKTININAVMSKSGSNKFMAAGGPVSAGRSYVVGEQGPEVVTMGSQGSVTPNHRLRSGGGSETIIIQVDGREIARAVRNHDRSLLPG